MEEKITAIKNWLGTGSINIFGLPMSGKDTVGIKLAEKLGARMLSSGMIIRAMEAETNQHTTDSGMLIATDTFYDWVLPYFKREELKESALILSSVGRWSGEENTVMETAEKSGHKIKAAILLNVSEEDVIERWKEVQKSGKREDIEQFSTREDDRKLDVFKKRINEFNTKTIPVIKHYQELGMLIPVQADMSREEVLESVINKLYQFVSTY